MFLTKHRPRCFERCLKKIQNIIGKLYLTAGQLPYTTKQPECEGGESTQKWHGIPPRMYRVMYFQWNKEDKIWLRRWNTCWSKGIEEWVELMGKRRSLRSSVSTESAMSTSWDRVLVCLNPLEGAGFGQSQTHLSSVWGSNVVAEMECLLKEMGIG